MSSPIKPPGGPPGAGAPEDLQKAERRDNPSSVSESFQSTIEKSAATHETKAQHPSGAELDAGANTSEARRITDDLRAGRIDAAQAVEALVMHALQSPTATALPRAQRSELESYLRAALADDPTLVGLAKDLARGE